MSEKHEYELDLTDKSAEEAAQALYEWLRDEFCDDAEFFEREAFLASPDDDGSYTGNSHGCWRVVWESGPYEWGVALTLGAHMHAGLDNSWGKPAEVKLCGASEYIAEPYHGFDVGFYEQQ